MTGSRLSQPDAIPSLRGAGFQITLRNYPQVWPYQLSVVESSPFHDKRVRQATNFAVDRDGLVKLLNGTAIPAEGLYPKGDPSFGNPTMRYRYDLNRARELMREAGYGPDRRLKAKVMISSAGSGQMDPLPMNELVQQNLRQAWIDVDFDLVELGVDVPGDAQLAGFTAVARRRCSELQPRPNGPLSDVSLLPHSQLLAQQPELEPLERSENGPPSQRRSGHLR